MRTNNFILEAKKDILKHEAEIYNRNELTIDDVEVVYLTYNMGFLKGAFVIPEKSQGRYYEMSYSAINKKFFLDVYEKAASRVFTEE